jgi:hypothetical protein
MIRAVALVPMICFLGLFSVGLYRAIRHQQARAEMETAITRLAMRCPPDIADEQWEICIFWTRKLHEDYGENGYAPTDDLERITRQLNNRLEVGPDVSTIDWLWDQYIEMDPRAAAYEKVRATDGWQSSKGVSQAITNPGKESY